MRQQPDKDLFLRMHLSLSLSVCSSRADDDPDPGGGGGGGGVAVNSPLELLRNISDTNLRGSGSWGASVESITDEDGNSSDRR